MKEKALEFRSKYKIQSSILSYIVFQQRAKGYEEITHCITKFCCLYYIKLSLKEISLFARYKAKSCYHLM